MNRDMLITFAMYYALFHKKMLLDDLEIITEEFPSNVFGIFSTIRRHTVLHVYPKDIHGCIGFWNSNFNSLSRNELYNQMLNVVNDSMWKDDRNHFFPPIQTDPFSFLELDFMVNPVMKINRATGTIDKLQIPFSNKTYGILIQSKDKRATYLPNVFPSLPWNKLVASILKKANITSDDDFELFAYNIVQVKSRLISILTNGIYSLQSIRDFTLFLLHNQNTSLLFPFIYSFSGRKYEWNSRDTVRNISIMSRIANYCKVIQTNHTASIMDKIQQILTNLDHYDGQSLSFLAEFIKKNKKQFCQKLIHDLDTAEPELGYIEILLGLQKAGCKLKLHRAITFDSNDSIFKINKTVQFILSLRKRLSQPMMKILQDKMNLIVNNVGHEDTNVIAVAWECLCKVASSSQRRQPLWILQTLFSFFYELEKRKMDVFYAFLDKTVLVDITGHVMDGFLELLNL
jgi:AMMECR1 domain-containing protein